MSTRIALTDRGNRFVWCLGLFTLLIAGCPENPCETAKALLERSVEALGDSEKIVNDLFEVVMDVCFAASIQCDEAQEAHDRALEIMGGAQAIVVRARLAVGQFCAEEDCPDGVKPCPVPLDTRQAPVDLERLASRLEQLEQDLEAIR